VDGSDQANLSISSEIGGILGAKHYGKLDAFVPVFLGMSGEALIERGKAVTHPRTRNFLPSEQKAEKISRTENRTAKCLPERERENFNHALFAFVFFPRRQDRELLGAISRGLLDCPRPV
jgi:hypothetical protein